MMASDKAEGGNVQFSNCFLDRLVTSTAQHSTVQYSISIYNWLYYMLYPGQGEMKRNIH